MINKSPLAPLLQRGGLLLITLAIFLFNGSLFAAEVRNEVVKQVGNRMVFEFDVTGEANEETEVNVTLSINGNTYTADKLHLEGDYGKVKAGKGRKIYWNVLQDFPRGLNTTFDWEIEAGGKEFIDSVTGMEFVFVKGGCYQMGCGDWTSDCYDNEKPVHEVCVDDFYLGKYEVTFGEFKKFINDTGYRTEAEKGDDRDGCDGLTDSGWIRRKKYNWRNAGFSQTESDPVVCVSWNDTNEYIGWLNKTSSKKYRLPTEAEWEYAARSGGKKEKWAGMSSESWLGDYAWYSAYSGNKTHPVGQKRPNGIGIYDMSGNVWELVQDWYEEKYYSESPKNNPKGPSSGVGHVWRGASWYDDPGNLRTAFRGRDNPDLRKSSYSGFRLLRTK